MHIACCDMEGIFVPEIWINVAEKTGIKELRLTTRDISDYDVLMKRRLAILDENRLKIHDIQAVIATMDPLDGALEFLDWLRSRIPVIIVSDTFDQFAGPLMQKLGWPTLFCHTLSINPDGSIAGYKLRQKDSKREAVISLKRLKYNTIAVGDSYNDITMLKQADNGILFDPPENVKNEFPDFPVTYSYDDLKHIMQQILNKQNNPKT
ncbi:MAG: bifunctional phosphoserine phosphatase/homoserine phosphotransferase ThrH [Deltaproteobacteria bacterium]|nr:bifunctional phosphoserine phosphatase/homoserine phosphotransferase ThrH [Deltaproteobacteria bacterium]